VPATIGEEIVRAAVMRTPAGPAAWSIPVTVQSRIHPAKPTICMQNVRNVGCVKHGASRDSKPWSEMGT
jgi:hypothetical protein